MRGASARADARQRRTRTRVRRRSASARQRRSAETYADAWRECACGGVLRRMAQMRVQVHDANAHVDAPRQCPRAISNRMRRKDFIFSKMRGRERVQRERGTKRRGRLARDKDEPTKASRRTNTRAYGLTTKPYRYAIKFYHGDMCSKYDDSDILALMTCEC